MTLFARSSGTHALPWFVGSIGLVLASLGGCGAITGEDAPPIDWPDDELPPDDDDGGDPFRDANAPRDDARTPDDDGGDGQARPTYKHYDINHVISTGQSDSVANGASPPLTLAQPFGNLSFDVGVMTGQNGPGRGCDGDGCRQYQDPKDFVPLVEGDRFLAIGGQPQGFRVETMSAGLANQATVLAKAYFAKVGLPDVRHDVLVSLHGRSGNEYACLRKGYCNYLAQRGYLSPFAEGLMQVTSAKAIAEAKGKSYVVRGVTTIHGGSDHYGAEDELVDLDRNDGMGKVGNYAGALMEWQRDYEAEVRAITGQSEPVPLFVSQFGSWTDVAVSQIPIRQMEAHEKAPGKVIVVTPNYPFVHYRDCLHYTNYSQRRLGAYFAKAYEKVVVEGSKFEPLRPIAVTRAGNVLTVKFIVPVPPMVLDTTRVTNPGNYGFTYDDSDGSATITSVALAGPDAVTITLSNVPSGGGKKLRYALNAPVPDACPGPTSGARGNLRDSDSTTGYHTYEDGTPYELFNWAVHFELDVP